ncbi:MAG: hypothetical protein KBD29_03740 [Candidatus Magasanikbacteria bacterium]|jgi:hypothetical protein|nr:hypothetical protein [Candidatus Magasanikbacteria bacterium]
MSEQENSEEQKAWYINEISGIIDGHTTRARLFDEHGIGRKGSPFLILTEEAEQVVNSMLARRFLKLESPRSARSLHSSVLCMTVHHPISHEIEGRALYINVGFDLEEITNSPQGALTLTSAGAHTYISSSDTSFGDLVEEPATIDDLKDFLGVLS